MGAITSGCYVRAGVLNSMLHAVLSPPLFYSFFENCLVSVVVIVFPCAFACMCMCGSTCTCVHMDIGTSG